MLPSANKGVSMKYINHFTINTKNNRISYPSEVEKELFFILKSKFKDAESENGVNLMDDTVFKLTVEENRTYAGTLYLKSGNELVPVLITYGTKEDSDRNYVWDNIKKIRKQFSDDELIMPPATPFIVDYILPTACLNPIIFEWTGDFTKCLAWMILFPEVINR